jgi:surfactin synthase thioesterase subunit
VEERVENFTKRTFSEFQQEAVLNKKYVDALNYFSAQYPQQRLLFTGHSLGGSLVSNLANAYTKAQTETSRVQVDLITFNSLAPSVTLGYFYEKAEKPKSDLVTVNPDIIGLHIYAYDAPLQIYNKIKNGTHYGKSIKLSSRRNMDEYGRLGFSAFDGHHMYSIAEDINFSRKTQKSSEFLLYAQKALNSGEAYKRIRRYWNTEEEEYRAAYSQNMRADRGKKYIQQLIEALFDPETILALGTPVPIGEIQEPFSKTTKTVYDINERLPLSL